jgi:DNA-binding transcriptional ArsR family regulator
MVNSSEPLDRVFQALADPTRRDIVERLTRAPASVSELAAPLPMSLPAVLQHIGVLETSGLVVTEKVGRVRTCRLDPAAIRDAEAWIQQQRLLWERRLDSLGDFLSPTAPTPAEPTPTEPTKEQS